MQFPRLARAPLFGQASRSELSSGSLSVTTECPLYLRGKAAVVERLVKPGVDNEEEGFGRNAGMKRHYYRIVVLMTEIWEGYAGAPQDRLCIEVFETWLEHAPHG